MSEITKSITFHKEGQDPFSVEVTASEIVESGYESFDVTLTNGDKSAVYGFTYGEFLEIKRLFASFL